MIGTDVAHDLQRHVAGLGRPAQIVRMGASVSDIVTNAALAAHDALR